MTDRALDLKARLGTKVVLSAAVMAGVVPAGGCGRGLEERNVNVFAASSLTDVFTEITEAFKRNHPNVDVVLQFAGSSRLAVQIKAGAHADVFASANERVMEDLLAEIDGQEGANGTSGQGASGRNETSGQGASGRGRASGQEGASGRGSAVFARNRLALAVPAENPGGVNGLASLGNPDLLVAACDPEVPCGALTEEVLTDAGAEMGVCTSASGGEGGERAGCDAARLVVDTHEPNVRSVLTKVMLGEVDAGLVYATDLAAGGEDVFGIPLRHPAAASYPLAVLSENAAAAEFADFVLSPTAQQILAEAGFLPP